MIRSSLAKSDVLLLLLSEADNLFSDGLFREGACCACSELLLPAFNVRCTGLGRLDQEGLGFFLTPRPLDCLNLEAHCSSAVSNALLTFCNDDLTSIKSNVRTSCGNPCLYFWLGLILSDDRGNCLDWSEFLFNSADSVASPSIRSVIPVLF